jgi:endonuclease III
MKTRPTRTSAPPPDVTDHIRERNPDHAPERPRGKPRPTPAKKKPFDIDEMMRRIRAAVKPYTPAAMFQLYDEGFTSVFEVLVGCIISIRTLDEVTLTTSRKLFAEARTPRQIADLSPAQIDRLIGACTFHGPKSRTIHTIATETLEKHGDQIPCDYDALTSFSGVGPKCANLVLGVACQQAHGVAVDIHVHRVTNRWGYVAAATPEQTMAALEQVLPKKHWIEINKLLVPFGKFVCTGRAPRCSTCPVLEFCRQVGVTEHR